jgi:hypothetical protein
MPVCACLIEVASSPVQAPMIELNPSASAEEGLNASDRSIASNALTAADLPVICVETRHMKALLTAQQINT